MSNFRPGEPGDAPKKRVNSRYIQRDKKRKREEEEALEEAKAGGLI